MINPFQEIDWKPDVAAIRKFGVTLTIGATILLFVFFGLWVFVDSSRSFCEFFASVFAVVLFIGLVVTALPKPCRPIYLVWYFLGACVGTVISNTILIAFYYCFFSVIAVVMRLAGRDPLQLKRPQTDSMWIEHKAKDLARYYRQY